MKNRITAKRRSRILELGQTCDSRQFAVVARRRKRWRCWRMRAVKQIKNTHTIGRCFVHCFGAIDIDKHTNTHTLVARITRGVQIRTHLRRREGRVINMVPWTCCIFGGHLMVDGYANKHKMWNLNYIEHFRIAGTFGMCREFVVYICTRLHFGIMLISKYNYFNRSNQLHRYKHKLSGKGLFATRAFTIWNSDKNARATVNNGLTKPPRQWMKMTTVTRYHISTKKDFTCKVPTLPCVQGCDCARCVQEKIAASRKSTRQLRRWYIAEMFAVDARACLLVEQNADAPLPLPIRTLIKCVTDILRAPHALAAMSDDDAFGSAGARVHAREHTCECITDEILYMVGFQCVCAITRIYMQTKIRQRIVHVFLERRVRLIGKRQSAGIVKKRFTVFWVTTSMRTCRPKKVTSFIFKKEMVLQYFFQFVNFLCYFYIENFNTRKPPNIRSSTNIHKIH